MFTQKCFIRKNTSELVQKLEELGYSPGFSARNNYGNSLQTGYHKQIGRVYGYEDVIDDNSDDAIFGVNCGKNEELFLAIEALRDDSDIHQWFTDGEKWVISDVHSLIGLKEYFETIGFNYPATHKATIEELIKHYGHESI